MEFASVMGGVQKLTGSASDAVSKALDEFNSALPTFRGLGFNVRDLHISMGVPPEISAKLTAAAADVDVAKLDDILKRRTDQKTLVAVLKALQTAYNVRDQLGDLGLKGIEVDVVLGLLPKISVGFLKSEAAPIPA
jgi:hypothetical protein